MIQKDPKRFEQSLKSSLSKFPGSKSYWSKQRKFLESIIEQKGMPTLFMTFSCADTHNLIIQKFMNTFPSSNRTNKTLNVAYNSQIVKIVFEQMLEDFFTLYLEKVHPIQYKFIRSEFQNRGTIHVHCLLKLKHEPSYK